VKEYWLKFESRVDALNLRERVMAFAIAALLLITLINVVVLDPLLAQQKLLSQQAAQDEQQITAMHAEIQGRVAAHNNDPDAAERAKLQDLKQRSAKLRGELLGMQKGLVSPDKMTALLEDLLRRNSGLQLLSLKTLPVSLLTDPVVPEGKAPAGADSSPAAKDKAHEKQVAGEAVYKHGVELTIQGSYADITHYLTQIESMPWQLFWAKAKLNVDAYPKAKLTLTLFTLSLDSTWLNI
jgi:MSHA biogenesis protein MshJ